MSRWRPPSSQSSPYITRAGYTNLEKELAELWQRRADVTRALTAAAAEGDRSENAEYIYRKKQLRGIDSRIAYLQKRMPKLKIVDQVGDENRVFFGASVTIENMEGEEYSYRIVGPDEIDPDSNLISIDSPMAKAMLGKSREDTISINKDGSVIEYYIVAITYPL